MAARIARAALVVAALAFSSACALSHRASISELKSHPSHYQDRSVNISGVVTDSWGVPLLPYKFYRVDDGTGDVAVLSNHTRTPAKGERVKVKGRVDGLAVLGGRAIGLHLREESLSVQR